MIPLKLTQREKEIVQRKFFTYCIKVLNGEALNYLKELERRKKNEVLFSELLQNDWNKLYSNDDYKIAEKFTVMGRQILVYDEWLSEAQKKLPEKKREIILMLFFLDMTEKEIATYLRLVQSTVHYHKKDSLSRLKRYME